MKRCPICQNTFDDSLRFCQLDGTLLVDDAGTIDSSGLPLDPLKTMVGGAPIRDDEDDLLQLGDDDATKTLSSPYDSPFGQTPFDASAPSSDSFSQTGSSPFSNESSGLPPFGSPQSTPFDTPNYQSPSTPFSEPPSFNQGQFDAAQNTYGQPLQQSWTPPPAPVAGWQSQNVGANTPFAPPMVGMNQDQTLPIISLVCGIISLMCCWIGFLLGPAALITGYLGKKNADDNPNRYGGSGMAMAGMITGGIGTLISVGYFLLVIIGAVNGSAR